MFDADRLYFANDPELTAIIPYSTAAHWRSEGRGPEFIKIGPKVAYRGSALNAWLEAQTVRPGATRETATAA